MRGIRDQYQMREILSQCGPNETREIEVAEEVAVDDEERSIAEQGKRLRDSARGFQRLGFARVADRDAEAVSIAKRSFDHVAEMCVIDHDLANARARERLDRPGDQRLAAHFEKHLGDRVGEGPHALAAPRGKYHGFHRSESERIADALFLPLELLEQAPERGKLAITLARAPQVAHYERLVFQIAVLSVPKRETREDPQHLELPLGSHPLEIPVEIGEIAGNRQASGPGLLPIADRPIDDASLVPGDVGVAQEGDEIVSDRTVYRVLKIENSGAGLADHEIAGMVVAVHEHPRLRE